MVEVQTIYWVGFGLLILLLLFLDLFWFHRRNETVSMRKALLVSAFWIALSLVFNLFVYFQFGPRAGSEFLTAYLIEKSLSVDNLFVFLIIFTFFKVPPELQHKVLFWGILGAVIMRGIFIFGGIQLIQHFHFTLYILGAFLVLIGIKIMFQSENEFEPDKSFSIKLLKKVLPLLKDYRRDDFFVRRKRSFFATPLFVVLVVIETSDVVFAIDSVPAVLAVSQDPFIVFTSNIFAILGLRALFFALSGVMQLFHYLKYGLSLILIFIGIKILIADFYSISIHVSLLAITGILAISIVISLLFPQRSSLHEIS